MDKRQQQVQSNLQWRFKLIKLLSIDLKTYILPFYNLELALEIIFYIQILKFSIDYFPKAWFGGAQPFFLYLDLSYYFNFVSASAFFDYLILFMVIINLYWMAPLIMQLYEIQRSNTVNNIRKLVYLIIKNILILPIFNVLLNLFNCYSVGEQYRTCYERYNLGLIFIFILSFIVFFALLLGQTFLDLEFIKREKVETRLRRTGITNCVFLIYSVLNELSNYLLPEAVQLAFLNLTTISLLIIVVLNNDEVIEKIKLMQYAFISVQLLGILFVNISHMINPPLPPFLFPLLAPALFVGIMQLKSTNLRFQLQNINKWPTPEIMISYARKLRDYLAQRDDYTYIVYIHGYMEIHRQKCDNPMCPSRCQLSEADRKLFENGTLKNNEQQLLRCENIIKKIYSDGYKLTPISPQLQLQNSIFLYERKEKEISLRNLLAIKLDRLPLDKCYCYSYLKDKIHQELNIDSNKFLDLVSEMNAKKQQEQIFQKFEKAALINLQFWSLLNDDHPDFQKLNQVGLVRIRIKEDIKRIYGQICSIAHSQRVTSYYANYLESIENDQHMFNEIYSNIKKKYGLDHKITLQDWANSSSNIMLVSIEDATYSKIVDVNTSCATALGYQKFQLINQSLKNLFLDELKNQIKQFLNESTNNQEFYIAHKSGYLMQITKHSQSYNSMETGMTSIMNIEVILNPSCCSFILDKNGKVMGVTPSIIPLIGIDLRAFQVQINSSQIFLPNLKKLKEMSKDKQISYTLKELVKQQFYQNQGRGRSIFKLDYAEYLKHFTISLRQVIKNRRSTLSESRSITPHDFQFRAEASVGCFKYLGTSKSDSSETTSKFSKLYSNHQQSQQAEKIYEKGITTLRLRDNVIQIIQEQSLADINQQNEKYAQFDGQRMILPRKDEEEIFQNKDSFQKFIKDYQIARYALIIMGIGIFGVIGMQGGYYAVYLSQNNVIMQESLQIARQHLLNGAVTKSQCMLLGLQLAANNLSNENALHFSTLYQDNLQYIEKILMLGSKSFPLSLVVDQQNINILTNSFILTLINSVTQFLSGISNATTTAAMWGSFKQMDNYMQSYLTQGSKQAKQQMYAFSIQRESEILANLLSSLQTQDVMISMGIIYLLFYSIFILIVINRINIERIDIFQIFLEISDTKIQQFSNRTQKLLISLHVEEANEEMDEDTDKKINSSTFAKKKSFKQITFGKSIYIKLIIIPLFFIGYFIHSYVISSTNLTFQKMALPYFRLSASADYILYSDLTDIQQAIKTSDTSVDTLQLASNIRLFYRSYFQVHYNSFGYIPDYHEAWIDLFFLNICPGKDTSFGSTTINQSCLIQPLSQNGTYMVVGDLIRKIATIDFTHPLSTQKLYQYETLSKSHRLITSFLLSAQMNLTNSFSKNILQIFIIWLLCGLILIFIWGVPMARNFIIQINQIKNIIAILPISIAKELPSARRYFYKILKQQNC